MVRHSARRVYNDGRLVVRSGMSEEKASKLITKLAKTAREAAGKVWSARCAWDERGHEDDVANCGEEGGAEQAHGGRILEWRAGHAD